MTPYSVEGQDDVLKCHFRAEPVQPGGAIQSTRALGEAMIVFVEAQTVADAHQALIDLKAPVAEGLGLDEVAIIGSSTVAARHGKRLVIANITVDSNVQRDSDWQSRFQALTKRVAGMTLAEPESMVLPDSRTGRGSLSRTPLLLVMSVLVFILLPRLLLRIGEEIAPARIDRITELGRMDLPIALVFLHFKVLPSKREPFTWSFSRKLLRRNLKRFAPGNIIPVRFNPLDGTPTPRPVYFRAVDFSRLPKLWLIRGFRSWTISGLAAVATIIFLSLVSV
jgi:hypothetical protein